MKIYVVRHGLTNSNKTKRLNGQRIDEPLEPEGIIEVEEASQNLPDGIAKIYASPMTRTRQTAEILNKKLNLEISYHPELMEVDFGAFTQRSWLDIIEEFGEDSLTSYRSQQYDFTSHGGDSAKKVHTRVKKILAQIKESHPRENILIVAHGGIVRALYYMYHGQEIEGVKNASVHEFEI